MKLEQQLTSLEISQRLKELRVPQESLFYWRESYHTEEHFEKGVSMGKKGVFGEKYSLEYLPKPRYTTADVKWNERDLSRLCETELSAFTVAELGEMLPKLYPGSTMGWLEITYGAGSHHFWEVTFHNHESKAFTIADTEADARGKMLIYLLENHLIAL